MRGRKPKGTELHLIEGTYRTDRHGSQVALFPGRCRGRTTPSPPRHLKGTGLRIWHATVAELDRLGLVDSADQGILALFCEAREELSWATYTIRREGRIVPTAAGGKKPHPAIGIKNAAALRVAKFAAELGLTPVARIRLRIDVGDADPDHEESDLD